MSRDHTSFILPGNQCMYYVYILVQIHLIWGLLGSILQNPQKCKPAHMTTTSARASYSGLSFLSDVYSRYEISNSNQNNNCARVTSIINPINFKPQSFVTTGKKMATLDDILAPVKPTLYNIQYKVYTI